MDIQLSLSPQLMDVFWTWVVPSLKKQTFGEAIRIHIINYKNRSPLLDSKEVIDGRISIFDHTQQVKHQQNLSFAQAHNLLFEFSKPTRRFLLLNPDVILDINCLSELANMSEHTDNWGAIEAQQVPFNHPRSVGKEKQTAWASGACLLLSSEVYQSAAGLDESFEMYCEDVDLSWRIQLLNKLVFQCGSALAFHYTGLFTTYKPDAIALEEILSTRNHFLLVRKFFGKRAFENDLKKHLKAGSGKQGGIENYVRLYLENFNFEKLDRFYESNRNKIESTRLIQNLGMGQYHEFQEGDDK